MPIQHFVSSLIKGLQHIFFPNYCVGCWFRSPKTNIFLCNTCSQKLPYTDFINDEKNPVIDKLNMTCSIKSANALWYYSSLSVVQNIVHQFKYNNHRNLAVKLGMEMGKAFLDRPIFQNVDTIIPIPLAPKRLKQRGYNQAELLSLGMKKYKNSISVNTELLTRMSFKKSQTKLHDRYKRFLNVKDAFIIQPNKLQDFKHIVIVDDIVTTGSTLSVCVELFNTILPKAQISVLCLGMTLQE